MTMNLNDRKINVWMSDEVLDELDNYAIRYDVARSVAARHLIRRGLLRAERDRMLRDRDRKVVEHPTEDPGEPVTQYMTATG